MRSQTYDQTRDVTVESRNPGSGIYHVSWYREHMAQTRTFSTVLDAWIWSHAMAHYKGSRVHWSVSNS